MKLPSLRILLRAGQEDGAEARKGLFEFHAFLLAPQGLGSHIKPRENAHMRFRAF